MSPRPHRYAVSLLPGLVLLAALLSPPPAAGASPDELIAAAVVDGRVEWLEVAGERALAIYSEAAAGPPRGGVILLHDAATHADWPDVIQPLRRALPGQGWATLSIQLPTPVRGNGGLWELAPVFAAGGARIAAAAAWLEQQGVSNIVVVGHGLGAAVAAATLASPSDAKIAGFVAVGMALPPFGDPAAPYRPELLGQIKVPVLDLYGSRDSDAVRQQAGYRAAAARRGGAFPSGPSATARVPLSGHRGLHTYRQIEIGGADHAFRGSEATLVKRVAGWLRRHVAGGAPDAAAAPAG